MCRNNIYACVWIPTGQEMKQNVLRTIKCRFATLLLEVQSAMEVQHVKLSDVHQFLLTSFQGECHIPEAPNLTKIFNTVTESKLWRYDNYIPLKKLAEKFLPDDDTVQNHVTEYRSQLSGSTQLPRSLTSSIFPSWRKLKTTLSSMPLLLRITRNIITNLHCD